MPWKNEGGGGGNRGPWGQGPSNNNGGGGNRGGGGGPTPPDLEEIIRRGQEALKRMMPGGGGMGRGPLPQGGGTAPSAGMGRGKWILPLVLLLGYAAFNSIQQVQPDERGVVLRLGQYDRTVLPGLRFALWPIETMERVPVEAEQQTTFGGDESGLMLADDQNLVDIRFTVLWKISNPEEYLFNVADQQGLVSAIAESAMREVVGRTPAEIVRTTGRLVAQDQVREIVQRTLTAYKAGINVTGVQLERADPPKQVIDAFEEVQRAEQDRANLINQADQYKNTKLRAVEGDVTRRLEDAKAYKSRVIAEAQGESQRFIKIFEEYSKAKDVTRQRIFLETLEGLMSKSNKVIIEGGQGGSGVVPYLPLPEIQKNTQQGGN
jgi:modulator of FtsH protease HflK